MAIPMELLLWAVPDLENSDDSRYLSLAFADHTGYHRRVQFDLLTSFVNAERITGSLELHYGWQAYTPIVSER